MARTSSSACGLLSDVSARCGSTSRIAVFSAVIFPLAAIEPEQSASRKKWRGRRASWAPGRSVMIVSGFACGMIAPIRDDARAKHEEG